MGVEVHIPARITVDPAGLEKEDGALVEEAFAQATGRALGKAADVVGQRHGDAGATVVDQPDVRWSGSALASVPASTRSNIEARLASAAASQRALLERSPPPPGIATASKPAWKLVKAVDFRARISTLARLLEQLGTGQGIRALYADRAEETRTATLRVIEAGRLVWLDDLVAEVERTVPRHTGERFFYGYTVYPEDRLKLVFLDADGTLSRELPDLTPNLRRAAETAQGVVLGPGALVVFLSFSLPSVVAEGALFAAPESQVTVPLRELDFLIEPDSFEAAFGVGWQRYAATFGDRPTALRLQPFVTGEARHYDTLDELLREAVRLTRVDRGSWFFGELVLLTEERLAALPAAARTELGPHAGAETRRLGPDRERGPWERGWDGAFVYAVLTPDRRDTEFARERALARERAHTLIGLLQGDRGELLWPYEILTFLRRHYRGSEPRAFEYLLRELEERESGRWFAALFDWVEVEENGDLHWYLIDLASRTPYARHARVTATTDLFNKRRRSYLPHRYFADRKEIWLDHLPGRALKQYELIYDVDTDYRAEKTETLLKPAREKALVEQVQKVAPQFIEDIFTGKENAEFADANALLSAIVTRAAAEIEIGEDDYYEKVTQRTLRLLDVQRRVDPFERYLITYRFEERVVGDNTRGWQAVPGSDRTDFDVDFQWLVWGWEYHHEAARMETFAIVVLGITGAVALAPVLVPAAGGVKVVLISIALSKAFYVVSTLWKGKEFTPEGFVMAAIDGYIGALGFRAGSIPAQLLARKIGGETTRRIIAGWIAEKAVASMIGGAGSAATMQFTHDLVNIAVRGGKLSTPEEYVHSMKIGLLLGFLFEAGGTGLRSVFRAAGSDAAAAAALSTADDLARVVQRAGLSPEAWRRIVADTLAALQPKLGAAFKPELAKRLTQAVGARLSEVGEHLKGVPGRLPGEVRRQFLERALQVSGTTVGQAATSGLARYARLTAGVLDEDAALVFIQGLRKSGRLDGFLRAMGELDDEVAGALARRGQLEALASSKHLLDLVDQHRGYEALAFVDDFFRGDVAQADDFFERLARQGGAQRTRAVETLLRPGQTIPPESMILVLQKGTTLTDEAVLALDRLFDSPLGAGTVDDILRGTHPSNTPGLLRTVAGATPAELDALLGGELLRSLSWSPAILRFAQHPRGLTRLIKLLTPGGRLGSNAPVVVDVLERLMKRRPGTSLDELGTIVDNLTFPLVDISPQQIEDLIEGAAGTRPQVSGGYIETPGLIEGGVPGQTRVREGQVVGKGETVVKGGKTYTEGEVVPPGVTKMDLQDIPFTEAELKIPQPELRQAAALRRVRRVIGRPLPETPLGKLWDDIKAEKLAGRTPQQVGREGVLKLYNEIRDEFWDRVRASDEHKQWLRQAGFFIDETQAAYLGTNNPHLSKGQTKLSLDHQFEKSFRENWVYAIDADNLVFEFVNPNSFIDSIQRAFKIGTYAPTVSPIGGGRFTSTPVRPAD